MDGLFARKLLRPAGMHEMEIIGLSFFISSMLIHVLHDTTTRTQRPIAATPLPDQFND